MNYQDINAETIDRWVKDGWEWGRPVSHETYVKAKQGTWDLHITPTKSVPHKWFGKIKDKKIISYSEVSIFPESRYLRQPPLFGTISAQK